MARTFQRRSAFTSIAVVAILILITACGGPEDRKAKYRLKAQEYMQAGNFPKARVALRNVLKIDPKDSEAYFLYAEVEVRGRRKAAVLLPNLR